jgi:aminomethyltransferase
MTYENDPLELGLERLVAWDLADDACLSLAELRRIKKAGVKRKLVGVEIDGDKFPALNNTKWPARRAAGGDAIGMVTSAIHSPRLKKNIGFCWVPADLAANGTKLAIDSEWGKRNATVVPMPFVDPEKRTPVS